MNQATTDNINTSQLLAPLQEGIVSLKRHFPEWEEVERLTENVNAIERRLSKASPRLLKLLGKGSVVSRNEERELIESRLKEKYS